MPLDDAGMRHGFHNALADRYNCKQRTAADWIGKARALGYLAPTQIGHKVFRAGENL